MDHAEAEKSKPRPPLAATLTRLATLSHRSRLALLGEFLRLRLGPGRLSFDEYVGLRLFESETLANADKTRFVGYRRTLKIWFQANYQVNVFGLVNNKIAADLLFAAHGFPVLPTFALFRVGVGLGGRFLIPGELELRAFLRDGGNYPLFGKPVSGYQSLGSTSMVRFEPSADCLVNTTGQYIPLDTYIAYVREFAASGYLFQRRISPHADVQRVCGDRLATVRLLTMAAGGRPKVIRACWKIPAGLNSADNFWRPGNLLAQIDLDSGRVLRVIRRDRAGASEITHHPDSGTLIQGMTIPNWREVLHLAAEGARVVDEMALIGWDIAPVDGGAVLVELNETPDLNLHQLADRRGILDDEFVDFLKQRKNDRAVQVKKVRQRRRDK